LSHFARCYTSLAQLGLPVVMIVLFGDVIHHRLPDQRIHQG